MAPKKGSTRSGSELEFKRWFRARLDELNVWSEVYEPRSGSGTGMPDMQILAKLKLLPIELKAGEVRNDRLFPEEVRPAQISWHERFYRAGGYALVIVGVSSAKGWYAWAMPLGKIVTWRDGWPIEACDFLVDSDCFTCGMRKILGK